MKTALRLCVSVGLGIALLGQTPPKDIDGWGKIKWGMTLAEARAAYNLPRKTSEDPGTANRGPAMTLDRVKIGDITDMAVWIEAAKGSDRICKVELANLLANTETFEKLKVLLIQKYGRPVSEETTRDEINARVTTVLWTFPSTSISLILREGSTIYLNYMATDKKARDVL